MNKLTVKSLEDYGFSCEREPDENRDEYEDGVWCKKGLTLYQSAWDENSFMFPDHFRENGEPKGGFNIDSEEQLEMLYEALCREKLEKV